MNAGGARYGPLGIPKDRATADAMFGKSKERRDKMMNRGKLYAAITSLLLGRVTGFEDAIELLKTDAQWWNSQDGPLDILEGLKTWLVVQHFARLSQAYSFQPNHNPYHLRMPSPEPYPTCVSDSSHQNATVEDVDNSVPRFLPTSLITRYCVMAISNDQSTFDVENLLRFTSSIPQYLR